MPWRLEIREGYVELRLWGVLDGSQRPRRGLRAVPRGLCVLVDFSEVERIAVPLEGLITRVLALDSAGLRVAFYAPNPALFGLNRQAIQFAGVAEGHTVSVFRSREAAVSWLLTGEGKPATEMGGSGQRRSGQPMAEDMQARRERGKPGQD